MKKPRHIKYHDIPTFDNFMVSIRREARFQGLDKQGEPIYDLEQKLPIVNVVFTEKIHGSNMGVVMRLEDEHIFFQGRNNLISPEHNMFGFETWAETKREIFKSYFDRLRTYFADGYNVDDIEYIGIFGEWAGNGVCKKSACSNHDKVFVLFDIKVVWKDSLARKNVYDDSLIFNLSDHANQIYNVQEIWQPNELFDLNDPDSFRETIEEWIEALEENSTFGNEVLGIEGNTGEGFVGKFNLRGTPWVFKIKGNSHAKTPKKPRIILSEEETTLRQRIAEQVTPDWRLSQMYDRVFPNGDPTMEKMGLLIKAVMLDIVKEDLPIITDAGLKTKDINGLICGHIRVYLQGMIEGES